LRDGDRSGYCDVGRGSGAVGDEQHADANSYTQIFEGSVDGWSHFYSLYPEAGGIVDLSRVGFDAALGQALVYGGVECGGLCGEGNVYLVSKANGAWVVAQQAPLWIS
jgi:hypothetical protein